MIPRVNKFVFLLITILSICISLSLFGLWPHTDKSSLKPLIAGILGFIASMLSLGNYALNWYETTINDERATVIIRSLATIFFMLATVSIILLNIFLNSLLSIISIFGIIVFVYFIVYYFVLKGFVDSQ